MKRIVVTGGAKGIGRAIVEELATGEYDVTLTYHESEDTAKKLAKRYKNVRIVHADLTDRNELKKVAQDLSEAGPIDVLISNAGLYVGKAFTTMTVAEVLEQADLNFAAVAQLTHGLLPALQQAQAPLIINISSQAAYARLTGEAMYSAAKAAVSTLSYVLRAELNPKGIRVTALEPFAVNTYGMSEPSNMILPQELAKTVRYIVELPDHLQIDTVGMSHIKQARPDYPEWIEQ